MLHYHNDLLHIEQCAVARLAEQFGTPCYAYSKGAIVNAVQEYQSAYQRHVTQPTHLCYAVKANSNIHILSLLAQLDCGFDIVSVGELERVLLAGGDAKKTVFSGVGKQMHELERALSCDIRCFNVESIAELEMLNQCAQTLGKKAPVSIRVSPDVDAKTHPYIATGLEKSKFGIDLTQAKQAYKKAQSLAMLEVVGIDCHIGSQITTLAPFEQMLVSMASFVRMLATEGIRLAHMDIGGGVGIRYNNEQTIELAHMAQVVERTLGVFGANIVLEPGRSIVGNAGALLTRCILTKRNYNTHFVVVDAAMNDLLRPALYQGHHTVWHNNHTKQTSEQLCTVVGPVCESGDFFAKNIALTAHASDLLALGSAGAYGFVMSSNYNSRPCAPEVLVDGTTARLIRRREDMQSMLQHELSV